MKEWFPGIKIKSAEVPKNKKEYDAARQKALSPGGNKEVAKKTLKILKEQGDGARGSLLLAWGYGGGHSVAYEVVGKKVILRDCQHNEKIKNPEKLISECLGTMYARLDNLEFNSDKIKEAVH